MASTINCPHCGVVGPASGGGPFDAFGWSGIWNYRCGPCGGEFRTFRKGLRRRLEPSEPGMYETVRDSLTGLVWPGEITDRPRDAPGPSEEIAMVAATSKHAGLALAEPVAEMDAPVREVFAAALVGGHATLVGFAQNASDIDPADDEDESLLPVLTGLLTNPDRCKAALTASAWIVSISYLTGTLETDVELALTLDALQQALPLEDADLATAHEIAQILVAAGGWDEAAGLKSARWFIDAAGASDLMPPGSEFWVSFAWVPCVLEGMEVFARRLSQT